MIGVYMLAYLVATSPYQTWSFVGATDTSADCQEELVKFREVEKGDKDRWQCIPMMVYRYDGRVHIIPPKVQPKVEEKKVPL